MTLPRPILDDRSYQQLRDELVRRISVYCPEWTDHNASDPGITLIELFAYLGENLLYRFNQIPEATELAFLDLLKIPMLPAQPARAILAMTVDSLADISLVTIGSTAKAGALGFETQSEVRVLPVSVVAASKSATYDPIDSDEPEVADQAKRTLDAINGLQENEDPQWYTTETVPVDGDGLPVDFDNAVDGILWVAVLNETDQDHQTVIKKLMDHPNVPLALNLGFVPDQESPPANEVDPCLGDAPASEAPAVQWQISTGRVEGEDPGQPIYRNINLIGDTTRGLTQEGVMRLRLPQSEDDMGGFTVDGGGVPIDPDVLGTGDFPPQFDEETEEKILFWLRVFRLDAETNPTDLTGEGFQSTGSRFGKVRYVGANATEVVQQQKAHAEFLGTGNGQPNQSYQLIHKPVIAGSVVLEVQEMAESWQPWQQVDGFFASSESDRHYMLDRKEGTVKFGNGKQGYVPQVGQRIRTTGYHYGGGTEGNVAAEAILKLDDQSNVKASNPLSAHRGADAETIADALDRIPGELRRRDRAVTKDDFSELARLTPGANVGRANCLARFHPPTRSIEAAGVVTVVVWPKQDAKHPDAPVPNRNLLRNVCDWLDRRRLVTTELYVIPPTYRQIAVSVGLQVKPGFGIDAVRNWVELVIRQYLAPLPPYGPSGEGWPLGRRVHGPELEAAALQVEGVEYLNNLSLADGGTTGTWGNPVESVELELDQVVQLSEITVVEGTNLIPPGQTLEPPESDKVLVPIPVIRQEC